MGDARADGLAWVARELRFEEFLNRLREEANRDQHQETDEGWHDDRRGDEPDSTPQAA